MRDLHNKFTTGYFYKCNNTINSYPFDVNNEQGSVTITSETDITVKVEACAKYIHLFSSFNTNEEKYCFAYQIRFTLQCPQNNISSCDI